MSDYFLLLSDKMCTFAHRYLCFVCRQLNNENGLTPANGISPNFSNAQKALSDSNKKLYDNPAPTLGGEVYLTDKEVSAVLKVSRRTLQDYRNNGILPYRVLGGKILYRESDIEKVLESGYKEAFRLSK